mmetsp:Transcript_11271/g.47061  ORF Transcript_11271/g.47061 Transcript_11271/m.47061 type:complete len:207 (+) Transcript_11271:1994-2614(+)
MFCCVRLHLRALFDVDVPCFCEGTLCPTHGRERVRTFQRHRCGTHRPRSPQRARQQGSGGGHPRCDASGKQLALCGRAEMPDKHAWPCRTPQVDGAADDQGTRPSEDTDARAEALGAADVLRAILSILRHRHRIHTLYERPHGERKRHEQCAKRRHEHASVDESALVDQRVLDVRVMESLQQRVERAECKLERTHVRCEREREHFG